MWYGTNFEYDSTTGYFKLTGNLVYATVDECRSKTKICGEYASSNGSDPSKYLYHISSFDTVCQSCEAQDGYYYVNGTYKNSYNAFSRSVSEDDIGIYKIQDDFGDSYYFRGNVTNNYVKFGTWKKRKTITYWGSSSTKTISVSAGDPMYWRIVRINGDGTIRMIYDGTTLKENATSHVASIGFTNFNPSINYKTVEDKKYAGYMYGTEAESNENINNSTIKTFIDNWYVDNLKDDYSNYISDAVFCNDRTEVSSTSNGYIYYAAHSRLRNNNINPNLICGNKNDKFTVDSDIGNKSLTYPIGLLTADEVVLAGGNNGYKNDYLHNGYTYITMTPSNRCVGYSYNNFYKVDSSIGFKNTVGNKDNVRPVINLKADVEFTGSGTIDDPYVIVTD